MLKVGDIVGISVETLYKHFGESLSCCKIEIENDEYNRPYYYDLFSFHGTGGRCHCDGENAIVTNVTDDYVEFFNSESPNDNYTFKLSSEECGIGIFGSKYSQSK